MKKIIGSASLALAAFCFTGGALAQDESPSQNGEQQAEINPYRADAESLEGLINAVYAYQERNAGGTYVFSEILRAEAAAVADQKSLLAFAERVVASLADHHAITGASFSNSYAVVPSYSDMWIEMVDGEYIVTAVRAGSPAEAGGVRAGDSVVMFGDQAASEAVAEYWSTGLGMPASVETNAYAARILAAGRRDSSRPLTLKNGSGKTYSVNLPSLYTLERSGGPVSSVNEGDTLMISINDALGNNDTIAAFDEAMQQATPGQKIVIDLTDTASGGNTVIARAILGWFVTEPRFYQIHELPGEQRATGIARRWAEQVLPRAGKFHDGPVEVRVGRWTGSMGEGLAIGFDALGACVHGTKMAGLLGAIYDHRLRNSGIVIKLPTERLLHVNGTPREDFVPHTSADACSG